MKMKDQVDLIIKSRKDKGKELEKRKKVLMAMQGEIKKYSALVSKAKGINDAKLREQYITTFSKIDSKNARKQIDSAIRKIDEGIKRFNRDYISIATVGKEGQGKSRFLQSVGNINNDIIPAYDAGSCTGATSIIWNDPTMPKGSVRTVISFRQPTEILDFVNAYINVIDPEYLHDNPLKFDEVGYVSLATLEAKKEDGNANQGAAFEHLTNIVEHFDEFKDLFGAPPITLTDPELIKTYVAQNNGKSAADPEVEWYYKYLAVSRADIYCPFFTDVGHVRLVDTVGIGATQHGIVDAMLNTVDQECDAAVVVSKPVRKLQQQDIDLYNSLRDKFKLRDTKKWLFYLVNLVKGDTDNKVDGFAEDIRKGDWSIADCRIVDASDQDAVRDNFVMPMINTLIANMDAIDSDYLKEVFQAEKAAYNEVQKLLENIPKMENINTSGMLGQEANNKGRECFNRMTSNLKNKVFYWSKEKENNNGILWARIQAILNNLDKIIPSPQKIQEISDNNGSLTPDDVWATMLHYIRNKITNQFIEIEDVLEGATLEFKNSLVESLYKELRTLSANSGESDEENCDMVEWLKTVMDEFFSNDPKYTQICKAFNFLYQFQFNTRAQLIQEVRRQLYIINPICAEYAPTSINFHRDCGKTIHFYLTSRMAVIEDELRFHLAKLYRSPNMAFYAAAEEFYDRLAFASDFDDNDNLINMSAVWGDFFQKYSSKIWEADAERFQIVNDLINDYIGSTDIIKSCLNGTYKVSEEGSKSI